MKRKLLHTLALLFVSLLTFAQTYTYDSNNRLTKVVYDNGTTITYTFDALGNRLSKKTNGSSANTFTVNVAVSPMGSGSVTGAGTFNSGAMIELNAIPNAGYEFSAWNDGATSNPRVITISNDMSLTAQFTEKTTSGLTGDINDDGKVNYQDMNALVDAYLFDTRATGITDLDNDGELSIADIANIIDIMKNSSSVTVNNNGHQYVDLGLPSGTLWATCNVGASAPEESGGLYAWGETETKDVYSWATYEWCDGNTCNSSNQTLSKYCSRGGYGRIDGKISLEPDDDVAHKLWGGDWHIPTKEQFMELADQCTLEWIKLGRDYHAFKFTGPNGNSIIMPAAGESSNGSFYPDLFAYWSSELFMKDDPASNRATNALVMNAIDESVEFSGYIRCYGYAVRPVLSEYIPIIHEEKNYTSYLNHDLVDLGLPHGTLWATCNLGASTSTDYGCYYAWGETSGSCDGRTSFNSSGYSVDKTETVEKGQNLPLTDDAASVKWSGKWRMPTLTELRELINDTYTTCEWTTVDGVNGYRITSKVKGFEGNNIFLPAAGYYDTNNLRYLGEQGLYWSSTLYSDHNVANNVGYIYFKSTKINWSQEEPWYGLPIRPVVAIDDINE